MDTSPEGILVLHGVAMSERTGKRKALAGAVAAAGADSGPELGRFSGRRRAHTRADGVGAVLNTSFNLHGEPIVASAADAVSTFERSGLPHVAIGHRLISKR